MMSTSATGLSDRLVGFLDRRREPSRRRDHRMRHIDSLDPTTDFEEIVRIVGTLEFPWDVHQDSTPPQRASSADDS